MMNQTRISPSIFLFSILLIFGMDLHECQGQTWITLFNGENLDGWTVQCIPADGDKEYWKVEEACIVCNSLGDKDHDYVWLATDEEFSDFHLKLQFQVFRASPGNSGVQFRSRYDNTDSARNGGWLNGPQADIHGPAAYRTGLIYDETEQVQRWIHPSLPDWQISPEQVPPGALHTRLVFFEDDPQAWNSMEILCQGMQVKTWVNGNPVTDFDASGILDDKLHRLRGSGTMGCIAFQLHSHDELKIKFKDILIREL